VRRFLFDNFKDVQLVLVNEQVFPQAKADVVLLLAEGCRQGPTDHATSGKPATLWYSPARLRLRQGRVTTRLANEAAAARLTSSACSPGATPRWAS
jgi:hypothetical protein